MTVQLAPVPKWRAFDANGDPLAGGLLYTYSAGTTNLLSSFTTRAGSVANQNPVVLDANGEADVWLTPGVDYKFVLKNSAGVTQWTVDNIPTGEAEDTTDDVAIEPGGRLTLATAVSVTSSDQSANTTVYYTPHKSNKVPLFNGTSWVVESFTELSQTTSDTTKSPAAVANTSNYDVFVWNDSGVLRATRGKIWATDVSRGTGVDTTELELLNGRLVNKYSISNGPAAQRGLYVGSIRSNGTATIDDTYTSRHVWNMYNEVDRPMYCVELDDNWNYSTAAYRQANGDPLNKVNFLIGWAGRAVTAQACGRAVNNTSTPRLVSTGIGVDSVTAIAFGALTGTVGVSDSISASMNASVVIIPGIGMHYLAWLEKGNGTDTQTWYGDNGSADQRNGISGITKG